MENFTLKREDVERVEPDLLHVFDTMRINAEGRVSQIPFGLVFDGGWKRDDARALMGLSPRALWRFAKHGLIPMTEHEALLMIHRAGRSIEPRRYPVARVQHANAEQCASLLVWKLQRGKYRPPTAPPAPPRIVTIE